MNISKFKEELMDLLGDSEGIYGYPELDDIFIISNDDALRIIRTMVMKYGFFEFIKCLNEVFINYSMFWGTTLFEASYLSEIDEYGYTHIHGLDITEYLEAFNVSFDMGDIIVCEYPKISHYNVVDSIVLGEHTTDTKCKHHRVYVAE